jgi:hypothetical protein
VQPRDFGEVMERPQYGIRKQKQLKGYDKSDTA